MGSNKWNHTEKNKYTLNGKTTNITITESIDKRQWNILFQPLNNIDDSDFCLHVSNLEYAQRIAELIDGTNGRF